MALLTVDSFQQQKSVRVVSEKRHRDWLCVPTLGKKIDVDGRVVTVSMAERFVIRHIDGELELLSGVTLQGLYSFDSDVVINDESLRTRLKSASDWLSVVKRASVGSIEVYAPTETVQVQSLNQMVTAVAGKHGVVLLPMLQTALVI